MTENFSSNRIDYLSFEYNEEIKENPYFKYLSKPLDSNSVVLLTKNYLLGYKNVKKVIKKLKHKHKTVYVREYYAKKFAKYAFVKSITPQTDEYYEALAVSKYVYCESPLFVNFVKRDGQFVFNNIPNQKPTLQNRVNLYLTGQKSSYFINKENPCCDYSFKDFLSMIANDKPMPIKKKRPEKNVLVLFNPSDYRFSLDYAMSMASQFDFDKGSLTLLLDNKYLNLYKDILLSFDERVNIAVKKGRILCSADTYRKMLFLSKEHSYIDDYSNINEFLGEEELQYEAMRIFGDQTFDKAINIGMDTFYWCRLIKSVCSDAVYVDNKGYIKSKSEYRAGKYKFLTKNYIVNFENISIKSSAEETDPELSNAPLVDFIARKDFDSSSIQKISIGDYEGLVIYQLNADAVDSTDALVVSAQCMGCDYLIAGNNQFSDSVVHTAKVLSKNSDKFVIFDFFDVISSELSAELTVDNIFVINSYTGYLALLDDLGKGYVSEECDNKIYSDAVNKNKKIYICDFDGNVINQV